LVSGCPLDLGFMIPHLHLPLELFGMILSIGRINIII